MGCIPENTTRRRGFVSAVLHDVVEENALAACGLALDLAGGAGFFREAGLERRFRDVQAARFHPLQKEAQAEYAGAMALGEPIDRIW